MLYQACESFLHDLPDKISSPTGLSCSSWTAYRTLEQHLGNNAADWWLTLVPPSFVAGNACCLSRWFCFHVQRGLLGTAKDFVFKKPFLNVHDGAENCQRSFPIFEPLNLFSLSHQCSNEILLRTKRPECLIKASAFESRLHYFSNAHYWLSGKIAVYK